MNELASFLNSYASIPVVLTAIYSVAVYKRLGSELKIFALFLFISGIVEIISRILWLQTINNLPLLHIYVLVGFLSLSWFYSEVLKGFVSRAVMVILSLLFGTFTILNSIFHESIYTFNSAALVVESILIIILSLSTYIIFLSDIVKSETDITLIKSLNWINSGLFIYYSSSLLIFFLGDFFTENYPVFLNQYTWALHAIFLAVMHICFFIGLWKRPKS
jgi:hypothetical protein